MPVSCVSQAEGRPHPPSCLQPEKKKVVCMFAQAGTLVLEGSKEDKILPFPFK
jgi:hypothetical protein